jgi:4-aminobutyrate aminotransferase/(S)-3-amino-2-methylpropionate transaminase
MNAWPPSRGEAIHTSTFLGNPLACSAGVAFLEELKSGGLVDRSRDLGELLLRRLQAALTDLAEVNEVRGRGLLVGVEFTRPGTKVPLKGAAVQMAKRALSEGILILAAGSSGHVLEFSPALVITEEQIEWAVTHMERVVREVLAE